MELTNSFEIDRSIGDTWIVLTDVERMAPCLPGAQLQEIEDEEYRGIVKIKVGPITAQYKGAATFVEKHDDEHRLVLLAKGRDTRGAGNAEALITASLRTLPDSSTRVEVNTDLKVTGRVAQFGRGVMADVSAKLMGQFVENLEAMLEADSDCSAHDGPGDEVHGDSESSPAGNSSFGNAAGPRKIDMPEPEAVDLLDAAGAPILKRIAPFLGVAVLLLILRRLRRK